MYAKVFSQMNAKRWEERATRDQGSWLLEILAPVIDQTVAKVLEGAPKEITSAIKGELLASQGGLARAVMHDSGEPADRRTTKEKPLGPTRTSIGRETKETLLT